MKKAFILLVCFIAILSCEKGEIIKGQFVLYEDASVLQTDSVIYGVIINRKAHKLNKQAEQYKKEPTDMVPVEIRGKITNKKDDKILWENKVEILEILNVSAPKPEGNNVVKLGK